MQLSALGYYLASIPTLLQGVKNWSAFPVLAARRPTVVELRHPALRFHVRSLMDLWIIKETCLDRDYETIGESLQDGWIVLDIGAGLGDFTVYAAKSRPHSRIYAYEPFPESYELLQENLKLNAVDNVQAFPYAVSDGRSAKLTLARTGEAVQHRTTPAGVSVAATVDVPCTSLDQVLADAALSRCDFLKIDVEGAEYEIMFGASDKVLSALRRVCLEYHDGVTLHSHADLVRFLQNKGYQVRTRPNPVHDHLGLLYAWK
jgi:FkbM family methyltransferase